MSERRSFVAENVIHIADAARRQLDEDPELRSERESRLERQARAGQNVRDREQNRQHAQDWHEVNVNYQRRAHDLYLDRYAQQTRYLTVRGWLRNAGLAVLVAAGLLALGRPEESVDVVERLLRLI